MSEEKRLTLTGNIDADRHMAMSIPFDEIRSFYETDKGQSEILDETFWREKYSRDFHEPRTFRELYLQRASRLSAASDHGLARATDEKNWDMVIYLINKYKDERPQRMNLSRVLHYAIINKQAKVINCCLSSRALEDIDLYSVSESDSDTLPAIDRAILETYPEGAEILIKNGAYISITELVRAIHIGERNIVELLLNAPLNQKDLRLVECLSSRQLDWLKNQNLV